MSARHCAPVILRLWPICMGGRFLVFLKYSEVLLVVEHRDRADRRAGAFAPFQRQADELEFALAEQGLEIAQALHMRDVELKAGLVHQRIHFALRPRPHRVDAEMHDALARQPLGRRDVDARIIGRIGRGREGAGVISARGLMWRRSMQMPWTMQFSSGYSLIGVPLLPKWRGASIWVPPWSGMEKNITLF